MKIIDGRKIAEEIEGNVKRMARNKKIKIATLMVKGNEESMLFAKLKERAFERVGFDHERIYVNDEKEVEREIEKMNRDEDITGINIQLPIPFIDYVKVIEKIDVRKDIEGMHPCNIGNTLLGKEKIIPCTPKAIIKIIEHEKIDVKGKNVVIVNHSNIIGKPLSVMLLSRNATVSVCHIYTKNLRDYTRKADILITATGVKGLIKEDYVKKDAIVIDAGIKVEGKKVYGDVDKSVVRKAKAITPVPGGVGPVTIACLLENAILAYEMQKSL